MVLYASAWTARIVPEGCQPLAGGCAPRHPPDDVLGIDIPIPEGSQSVGAIKSCQRIVACLHPSGIRIVFREIRWCRSCLAPPPANRCQAFGLGGAARSWPALASYRFLYPLHDFQGNAPCRARALRRETSDSRANSGDVQKMRCSRSDGPASLDLHLTRGDRFRTHRTPPHA